MKKSKDYKSGYKAGLKRALRHVRECDERNIQFLLNYPDAPHWQRRYTQDAILLNEAYEKAFNKFLKEAK